MALGLFAYFAYRASRENALTLAMLPEFMHEQRQAEAAKRKKRRENGKRKQIKQ